MISIDQVYKEKRSELEQTSEIFRDEVMEYISENGIKIRGYSVVVKEDTVELRIESDREPHFFFTFNRNNGDYGVLRVSQEAFDLLSDTEKI